MTNSSLSKWVFVWFVVTAVICTWDALFIILRPHTLPGGKLSLGWYLYKYYITVDKRYKDVNDSFVFSQSLLNLAEVALNVMTILLHYRQSRHTVMVAFTVCVMTFWKTVLYFLMYGVDSDYRADNTILQEILIVVIPNGVWIIAPLASIMQLWNQIVDNAYGSGGQYKQQRSHVVKVKAN